MTLHDKVEQYLKDKPQFRERAMKDRGIVNLLLQRYGLGGIDPKIIVGLVQDYATMDRAWRQILESQPELRGNDYNDKERLISRKLEELGYTSNLDGKNGVSSGQSQLL